MMIHTLLISFGSFFLRHCISNRLPINHQTVWFFNLSAFNVHTLCHFTYQIPRDGVLEAMALTSRRLEDNSSCTWLWLWPWSRRSSVLDLRSEPLVLILSPVCVAFMLIGLVRLNIGFLAFGLVGPVFDLVLGTLESKSLALKVVALTPCLQIPLSSKAYYVTRSKLLIYFTTRPTTTSFELCLTSRLSGDSPF